MNPGEGNAKNHESGTKLTGKACREVSFADQVNIIPRLDLEVSKILQKPKGPKNAENAQNEQGPTANHFQEALKANKRTKEENQKTQKNSNSQIPKKSCLPGVDEHFAFGFDLGLEKAFLFLPTSLRIIQKIVVFVIWAQPINKEDTSSLRRENIRVLVSITLFFLLAILFRLGKPKIRKNWILAIPCYLVDTAVSGYTYGRFLHLSTIYTAGLILAVYFGFLASLAGDLALLLNVLFSGQSLMSIKVYFTALPIFLVLSLSLFIKFFQSPDQLKFYAGIPEGVFCVILWVFYVALRPSFAAKEVLIAMEKLDEAGMNIKLGESFYHAITARGSAFGRQILFLYSKVFGKIWIPRGWFFWPNNSFSKDFPSD